VVSGAQVSADNKTQGAFGADFGLGVDFLIAHRFMLGTEVSYNLVTDFSEPIGGKKNYSGMEYSVSISWLFGQGFEG
jgi:hypothetical protein